VTRSSILTLKNTELKLCSKFEPPVDVDIVPWNAWKYAKCHNKRYALMHRSWFVRYYDSKDEKTHKKNTLLVSQVRFAN